MSENRRDKVNKKNRIINSKLTKLILVILLIAIILLVYRLIFSKDKLYGSWTTDGNTVYTFDGKSQGYLTTSVSKYKFSYKIKKDNVHIDFKVEKAKDSDYEFSVNKNSLTLKGINKTTGTYTLNKK